MDAGRFLPDTEPPLSRPLAGAYLGVVALVWLSHVVVAVLAVATGRSSWTTEDPWIAVPAFLVTASAVGVVWLVDRRLHRDRPRIAEAPRMIALAYGWAVPAAWRRLRG